MVTSLSLSLSPPLSVLLLSAKIVLTIVSLLSGAVLVLLVYFGDAVGVRG